MIKEKLLQEKKKEHLAVIVYIIYGYPDIETSQRALEILKEKGVSIYETAVPIPIMYSPQLSESIMIAHKIACQNGVSPQQVFKAYSLYRPNLYIIHEDTPLGLKRLLLNAKEDIDGVLIHWDKRDSKKHCKDFMKAGIEVIQEISPKLTKEEIKERVEIAEGFIYLAVAERTGGERYPTRKIEKMINSVKEIREDIPICCGFGIKSLQDIIEVGSLKGCDGIIIGTAALNALSKGLLQFDTYLSAVVDAAKKITK